MKQPRADLTETGIPWVGKVPAHWTVKPLWALFERIKDVDHPEEQMLSVFRDHGVVAKDSRDNLNKTAENRSIYQLVHPGWLVANRMKAWQGSVGISSLRGIVSGHYICFAPRHNEDHRYLNWLLRSTSYANGYALLSRGVRIGQAEIDNDKFRQMPILLPPLGEQRAIADYIDRETARIDTLIDEQQRLIELLRERRRAVMGHGVEGADGQLVALKFGLSRAISDGPHETPEFISEGIPFLSVDGIQDGRLTFEGCRFISEQDHLRYSAKIKPERGDVLMGKAASTGKIAIVDTDREFNVWSPLAILRPAPHRLDGRWIEWALKAPIAQAQIDMACTYNTQKNISMDDIGRLRIAFPSLGEQRRIAAFLDEQTAKIDRMIAETERFIELSKERRLALITAAVTGQIDLRAVA